MPTLTVVKQIINPAKLSADLLTAFGNKYIGFTKASDDNYVVITLTNDATEADLAQAQNIVLNHDALIQTPKQQYLIDTTTVDGYYRQKALVVGKTLLALDQGNATQQALTATFNNAYTILSTDVELKAEFDFERTGLGLGADWGTLTNAQKVDLYHLFNTFIVRKVAIVVSLRSLGRI